MLLNKRQTRTVRLGYLLDRKSSPGEKYLYVVAYTGSTRNEGFVFGVAVERQGSSRTLTINNNGRFATSGLRVDFVRGGDPLGGIWTQGHMISAIETIKRRPEFAFRVKNLRASIPSLTCDSYVRQSRSAK
jgi:hypothetical protein